MSPAHTWLTLPILIPLAVFAMASLLWLLIMLNELIVRTVRPRPAAVPAVESIPAVKEESEWDWEGDFAAAPPCAHIAARSWRLTPTEWTVAS